MNHRVIAIVLIACFTGLQAAPHHRHHRYPYSGYYYTSPYYYPGYLPYYNPYRPYYSYYRPVVVTTVTKTIYPQGLVTLSAEEIARDIVSFNKLLEQGVISEREFFRVKKTLLNRIGMSVNPETGVISMTEIIDQLKTLYRMQNKQLLTRREYQQQKKKLLAMI